MSNAVWEKIKKWPEIVLVLIALILIGVWGSEMSSKTQEPLTDAERDNLFKNRGIVPVDTNIQLVAYNKEKTDFTPVNMTLLTAGVVFGVSAIVFVLTRKWDRPTFMVFSMIFLLIAVICFTIWFQSLVRIPYYPSAEDLTLIDNQTHISDEDSNDFKNAGKDLAITRNPENRKAYYDVQNKKRYKYEVNYQLFYTGLTFGVVSLGLFIYVYILKDGKL